jgi:predicted kinase
VTEEAFEGSPLRLPDPCLVVLVGATAAGKSQWARAWFDADHVVSSDRLRAVVGTGERDQRASRDAFEVLDLIVAKRMRRRLTTVIDSTGLEAKRRAAWRSLAERHGVPIHVVVFDPPASVVRERNRARGTPVPGKVVTGQLREVAGVAERLAAEGFDAVHRPGPVALVPQPFLTALDAAVRQKEDPMTLEFGLQVSGFDWPGHAATTRDALAEVARAAEGAGFTSLWLMDHFLQIPQIGREWEDMLESYTTLGYLAGVTERIRLGALVTGITYRNIAHLAKIVATLDVLSGGRALCGLGAAWSEREHALYGWEFPSLAERYARLEDALELLPLMWGPRVAAVRGANPHRGRGDLLPPAVAGAPPDPRRRRGRAPHVAPGRPARRRVQPLRRPRHRPPQARRALRALRRGGGRSSGDHRHPLRARARHRRGRVASRPRGGHGG